MLSLCSCARRSTSRIFLIDTLFVGIGCPPLFLLTEGADHLIRVSTGAIPARLSPAVRDHRNDCPEIDWIQCPQVGLNLRLASTVISHKGVQPGPLGGSTISNIATVTVDRNTPVAT